MYEAQGDQRSRAITLGEIAEIKVARGEGEAARRRQEEALAVYQALGISDRGR